MLTSDEYVTRQGAPELKQLPHTKKNYRGKNPAGGRKCVFSQSREYTRKLNNRWGTMRGNAERLASGVWSVARTWGKDWPCRERIYG